MHASGATEEQIRDNTKDSFVNHKDCIYNWYHTHIIKRNAKNLLVFTFILILLLYFCELTLFIAQQQTILKNSHKQLQIISMFQHNRLQDQISNMKIFLDSYRQLITNENIVHNQSIQCTTDIFDCPNSNFSSIYPILNYNQYFIEKLQNYYLTNALIFLINNTSILYHKPLNNFTISKSQLLSEPIQKQIIKQHLQNHYSLNAFSINLPIKTVNIFQVCSFMNQLTICVASQFQTSNKQYIIVSNYHQNFSNKIDYLENIMIDFYESHKQFISGQYKFRKCIENYLSLLQITHSNKCICNGLEPGSFTVPFIGFVQKIIQIDYQYYQDSFLKMSERGSIVLEMYTFPNKTLIYEQLMRINQFNIKVQSQIKCLILFVLIWIGMMPLFSTILKEELMNCLKNMLKMGKIIKEINSKVDIETKTQSFNKIYKEYSYGLPLFQTTILIFKYIIWYKTLIFTTSVTKQKQLLDEGLSLFSSAKYAQIITYIYHRKIQLHKKDIFYLKKLNLANKQRQSLQNDVSLKLPLYIDRKERSNSNFISDFNAKSLTVDKSDDQQSLHCSEKILEQMINKKLISLTLNKNKKGVRFSNEQVFLQNQIKPQLRASKFMLSIPSESQLIKNSEKSIDPEIIKNNQKQSEHFLEEDSRKDISEKTLSYLKEENQYETASQPLINMRFHQENDHQQSSQSQDDQLNIKNVSQNKVMKQLILAYKQLISYYDSIIVIKQMSLKMQPAWKKQQAFRYLYEMYTEKIKYNYKLIKVKSKYKQKKQKILSKKLIMLKKERRLARQINKFDNKSCGSEKMILSKLSLIQEQFTNETDHFDTSFNELKALQQTQKIQINLIERASLYQIKLLKILNNPIPYKQLQSLCESSDSFIRVQSHFLMAAQFCKISPHADLQVLLRLTHLLEQNQLTHTQKRKILKKISHILSFRQQLIKESEQITEIRSYYNYDQKKFYFIADFSDVYDFFLPFLKSIYDAMNKVDVFEIYNLAMNECFQDMVNCQNQIKPKKFEQFQQKFQNLQNQTNKIRSIGQTKLHGKKVIYEKDFNKILGKISTENCSSAKYLVLLLGGQTDNQSRSHEDHESSCAYNRQIYQALHQQIIKKMEKNYFHVILVGFNLKDFQTKQGKLKKYAKHTHDLLQVDISLTKNHQQKYHQEISSYLSRPI